MSAELSLEEITVEIELIRLRRIGVLEDDPAQLAVLKKNLEAHYGEEIELICCETKDQAIIEFLGQELDFVILDINLPEPEGFAIGKVLRGFTDFRLPIIYTSANHEYVKEFCLSGQQDIYFLPKPFTSEQLKEVIETTYAKAS